MNEATEEKPRPERITFAPGEIGMEDLALIMQMTRHKGQTDAAQWALRFAAHYLEYVKAAKARGREGYMEWVEADPASPENVLWRIAIDPV